MIELRQSTAGQEVPLGHFVDSTDGDTEETGLTISASDIKIWHWGSTSLALKNSGGATHMADGAYYCVLDATDTATLGPMVIFVHVSGALAVRLECCVIPANVWDSRYSTDKLQVDAVEISGDSTAADNLESAAGNYSATRGLAGTALPAAAAGAAGGLPISDAGGLDMDALADTAWIGGTVTDGDPAAGEFDGDAGLSATDDIYNGMLLVFKDGTLAGQNRRITDYTGATKTFTFSGAAGTSDAPFLSAPANSDTFILIGRM